MRFCTRAVLLTIIIAASFSSRAQVNFSKGSFIVNMGVVPQTVANGLKPYGMVYDLIINYKVPVVWSINSGKAKDGADFTYNSTTYKGGTFIIPAEFISSAVSTRITYWKSQGISGSYATSSFSAPVYDTLTSMPKIMLDDGSNNTNIIINYFNNASISSSAYVTGIPSDLTSCTDMWVNPHDDPTWDTHGYLYDFVTSKKGNIWAECHEVSVMESVKNPSSPYQQLNFLSTKGLQCYSNSKCSGNSELHTSSPNLSASTYSNSSDPIMQFMGSLAAATQNGSEKWYIPLSTGRWNSGTRRAVTTANGSSPGEGVLLAYGPAFNNSANGTVMYTAGHDLDNSNTEAANVAAQRALMNFMFYTGIMKRILFVMDVPVTIDPGTTVPVSGTLTAGTGSAPYTYKWTSRLGGTFTNSTVISTNYKAPNITDTSDVITLTITDACGRVNFRSKHVNIKSSGVLPVSLTNYSAVPENKTVVNRWSTASEINNEYFTIERSMDAKQFEPAGKVKGAMNSNSVRQYSFTDPDPYPGTSYYRLGQTDVDGHVTYSAIESVTMEESATPGIRIFPNPSDGNFKVWFDHFSDASLSIQIYNVVGSLVMDRTIPLTDGHAQLDLNLKELEKGEYYLLYSGKETSKIKKILIR